MLLETLALMLGMQATTPPATPQEEILVTGQRLTPETARRFVNGISRPVSGQLPTFREPVCPDVTGMVPEHAAVVVKRIRKLVQHVGVPLADEGCAPNLRVIIPADSQAFVAELAAKKPGYFEGMDPNDVKRLLKDQSPALAWNSLQVQNEDGHVFKDNESGTSPFDRNSKTRVDMGDTTLTMPNANSGTPVMRTRSASIIKTTTRQAMLESYVVIEAPAVSGKSLMQIADYATMRALAAAQPPKEAVAVDTILTLFNDAGEAPPSIRVPDVAYLKALYSAPPTMSSVQQINRLSKAVLEASGGQ